MSKLSADDRRGIDAIRSHLVSAIIAGDSSAYAQYLTAAARDGRRCDSGGRSAMSVRASEDRGFQ